MKLFALAFYTASDLRFLGGKSGGKKKLKYGKVQAGEGF